MNYRAPGIYLRTTDFERIPRIALEESSIAGFVGLAEEGPYNQAVRVYSFRHFQSVFGGFVDFAYLPYAVHGYFNNGGRECVVVRIAHLSDGPGAARKAALTVRDGEGNHRFTIRAAAEGERGNLIRVKLWYGNKAALPVLKTEKGGDWVEVEQTEKFAPGDVVCLRSGRTVEYHTVSRVEAPRLFFHDHQRAELFAGKERTFCENKRISLSFVKQHLVEDFIGLSPNSMDEDYFVRAVNSRSRLVQIEHVRSGTPLPMEMHYSHLEHGDNGVAGLTPGDFIGFNRGLDDRAGLGVLEGLEDIAVIAAPDLLRMAGPEIAVVHRAMIDHCARDPNRFAILDIPDFENILEARKWAGALDSAHGAVYYPKIEIRNPDASAGAASSPTVSVPPSGHVAGVYSYFAETEGIMHTPANRFIKDSTGVTREIYEDEYEIIYEAGVNYLKHVPGQGVTLWGARTLSKDPEWRYFSVRRVFSAISQAIRDGTQWAVFENYSAGLRNDLVSQVNVFLWGMWNDGYLRGESAEEAFYVLCNAELNPPEMIRKGIVTIAVGLAIVRPAEFLVATISVKTAG